MDETTAEEAVAAPVLNRILQGVEQSSKVPWKVIHRLARQEMKRINKKGFRPEKPWQTEPLQDQDKQWYVLTCETDDSGALYVNACRLVKR